MVLSVLAWMLVFANSQEICQRSPEDFEFRPQGFQLATTKDYDKRQPPVRNNCPAVVTVKLFPWKIGDISIERMTFEVDLFVVLQWHDHRVTFSPTNQSDEIPITAQEAQLLWIPIVNFRNVMGNEGMIFNPDVHRMRIRGKNFHFFMRKVTKFHCDFNLRAYPMDKQKCYVEVQSNQDFKATLVLKDGTTFYGLWSQSSPLQFDVASYASGNCSRQDGLAEIHSCVEYSFILHRQIGNHLMMTYAPSFLIVILSWISFWLDVDAVPPRVALGLTSLLTLATQFSNAQKNLPPVAYVKAIDVWMFTCIFSVFASLIESAIVNYLSRAEKKREISEKDEMLNCRSQTLFQSKTTSKSSRSVTVDYFSRIGFPSCFAAFNLCYWGYYGSRNT